MFWQADPKPSVLLRVVAADVQGDELSMKYKRVSIEDAEQGWNEVYEASLDSCMHGMYCQQGADCQVAARHYSIALFSI